VYDVNTGYHATWGPFLETLGKQTTLQRGADGTLPADLNAYRVICISGDLKRYAAQRERLRQFVGQGGTLVLWFIDDERSDPEFFPYQLVNTGDDSAGVRFVDKAHPLLEGGLRGKRVANGEQGGDLVRQWDKEKWTVLAETNIVPAMLTCEYGQGRILVCQFSTGFAEKADEQRVLANNLVHWANVRREPED
jgi:hypothetical protein